MKVLFAVFTVCIFIILISGCSAGSSSSDDGDIVKTDGIALGDEDNSAVETDIISNPDTKIEADTLKSDPDMPKSDPDMPKSDIDTKDDFVPDETVDETADETTDEAADEITEEASDNDVITEGVSDGDVTEEPIVDEDTIDEDTVDEDTIDPAACNLSGWTIEQTTAAGTYSIPAGTILAPHGILIIARGAIKQTFASEYGVTLGADVSFISTNAIITGVPVIDGDETFTLKDSSGTVVDGPSVAMAANPAGKSYKRLDSTAAGSASANWDETADTGATPGSIGSMATGSDHAVISEFSDRSGDYTKMGNEFVEIYCDRGEPVKVTTPVITPTSGSYNTPQTITITSLTKGATIHYTDDGSTPTSSSTAYSVPITVSLSSTIKAIAVKAGMADSDAASQTYVIPVVPVNPAAGLSFTDTDQNAGKIGGTVTITKAANESDLTHYVLYFSDNGTAKTGTALATIAKTGANLTWDMPADTALSTHTHIMVFTKNTIGEMATGVATSITDLIPLSTDAHLSAITISSGVLTPNFDKDIQTYTVSLPYSVDKLTVTAIKEDSKATMVMKANSAVVTNPVSLTAGADTVIEVIVTAEDGTTKLTYTITAHRAAPSNDPTLKSLSLSAGSLSPVFAAGTTIYTVSLPNTVAEVTVSWEKNNANANASLYALGLAATNPIALEADADTLIEVYVLAEDGATHRNYSITVHRAAP